MPCTFQKSPDRPVARRSRSALCGLPLSAVVLIGGAVEAQGTDSIAWTIPGGGTFTRVVEGDLGLPSRSLVALKGGVVGIVSSPATSDAQWDLVSAAVDLTFVASPVVGSPGPDALIVAHSTGLTLFRYDPLATGDPMTASPISTPGLMNIKLVRAGDLDGDGLGDLVVVTDDPVYGDTVHLLHQGPAGTFSEMSDFSTYEGHVVRDAAIAVFSGLPLPGTSAVVPEILLCTDDGLDVHNQLGSRLWNLRTAHTDSHFAVVTQAWGPYANLARVALVHRNVPGNAWRLTMCGFMQTEDPVPLGQALNWPGMLAVSAGDRDGDGDDDLAIVDTGHLPRIFINQRGATSPDVDPTFTNGQVDLPWTLTSTDLEPAALLADVDRDGRADLYASAINPPQILRLRGTAASVGGGGSSFDHPVYAAWDAHYATNDPATVGNDNWWFEVYVKRSAFANATPGQNDLELALWREPTAGAHIDPISEAHFLFVDPVTQVNGSDVSYRLTFTLPRYTLGTTTSADDLYYFEVSLVDAIETSPGSGTYEISGRRRPYVGGLTFAFDTDVTTWDYLKGLDGAWYDWDGPDGGTYVGGFVDLPLLLPPLPPIPSTDPPPTVLRPAVPVPSGQPGIP